MLVFYKIWKKFIEIHVTKKNGLNNLIMKNHPPSHGQKIFNFESNKVKDRKPSLTNSNNQCPVFNFHQFNNCLEKIRDIRIQELMKNTNVTF